VSRQEVIAAAGTRTSLMRHATERPTGLVL